MKKRDEYAGGNTRALKYYPALKNYLNLLVDASLKLVNDIDSDEDGEGKYDRSNLAYLRTVTKQANEFVKKLE